MGCVSVDAQVWSQSCYLVGDGSTLDMTKLNSENRHHTKPGRDG